MAYPIQLSKSRVAAIRNNTSPQVTPKGPKGLDNFQGSSIPRMPVGLYQAVGRPGPGDRPTPTEQMCPTEQMWSG